MVFWPSYLYNEAPFSGKMKSLNWDSPLLPVAENILTHWSRGTHICVSNLAIIGSDNGLSPGWRQAIIWSNAGNIVNWTLGNQLQWNFNQNSNIFIHENGFESVVCEMAAILSRPQCVDTLKPEKWQPYCEWHAFHNVIRINKITNFLARSIRAVFVQHSYQFLIHVLSWHWQGSHTVNSLRPGDLIFASVNWFWSFSISQDYSL